jgi:DNA-binding MurR/RpiR family transcriptional regulator
MSDHMSDKIKWLSVAELSKQLHKSESTIKRIAKKLQISQPKAVRYEGKKMLINAECIPPIVSGHSEQLTDNERSLTDSVTDSHKITLEQELTEVRERELNNLQRTIEILQGELIEKNKQIENLTKTIYSNSLQLQLLPTKRSWWRRIFKK